MSSMMHLARMGRNVSRKMNFSTNMKRVAATPADVKDHRDRTETASSPRLEELRERLAADDAKFGNFSDQEKYDPSIFSEKAKSYLMTVNKMFNPRYSRGGSNGEGYVGVEEVLEKAPYYNEAAKNSLLKLAPEIQHQMRVKVSAAYVQHALEALPANAVEPSPILKVIVPDELEILYREIGETDPSNQNKYSPMPGLLHKYNMLLAMTSINCSSHCRYCYRSDLFNGSSGKSKADLVTVAKYIKSYNEKIDASIEDPSSKFDHMSGSMVSADGEPLLPLREILLSGGDPLTLPNATLARYLTLMAEAGMRTVRIGSKEVAFNPNRFDAAFWSTLDLFHVNYPDVRIELVGHYVHPYELVRPVTDNEGKYVYSTTQDYVVHPDVETTLNHINARRSWFGHFNQFPIIAGVNDTPAIMRLLLHLTNKLGIGMHNVYACREVIGNPHFRGDLTITKQYDLLEAAKIGLSGLENHARLIMSTEQGKMDVLGHKDGKVYMRVNRFIHGRKPENTTIVVDTAKIEGEGANKFYWLTQDVIDTAVDEASKRMLNCDLDDDTTFIRGVKTAAALSANSTDNHIELTLPKAAVPEKQAESTSNQIDITVLNNSGEIVNVIKTSTDKHKTAINGSDDLALADILVDAGHAEMVCGGQLSCTTCVGKVVADYELPSATLDEMDATDTLDVDMEGQQGELRACCQIKVRPGQKYQFQLAGNE